MDIPKTDPVRTPTPKKKKARSSANLVTLHCLIYREDAELLKNNATWHGERAHFVRNLIRVFCNKIRNKEITKYTPLEEVFNEKKKHVGFPTDGG